MNATRNRPGLLIAVSVLARLPSAMLSVALLVHVEHMTGSFAAAGLVTAAYAVGRGVGGPLLGRLVDARGQRPVLLASAWASGALLCVTGMAPSGVPIALLVAGAAGVGVSTPPVAACVLALLPRILRDPGALRSAYALDATAVELTFIGGPPLALGIGALWSTGAAVVACGLVTLIATLGYARCRETAWLGSASTLERAPGGALRAPAVLLLVLTMASVGVLFGAVELGVTAVAQAAGSTEAAGPLLAVWGLGSMVGGLLATRVTAHRKGGTTVLLTLLAAGHLLLLPATGHLVLLGAVLVFAGAAIAPTYAAVNAVITTAAPDGTATEAFAWLFTAVSIGSALGAAGGGALVDAIGAAAPFAMAGVAGAIALLTDLARGWLSSDEIAGAGEGAQAAMAS